MASVKRGYLSQYFAGVAAKTLSAVEAHPERSNQHEFNGSNELKAIFGSAGTTKIRLPAKFLYIDDDSGGVVVDGGVVTWYDARARSAARTRRSEHRLYFPTTAASTYASEGDLLFIAKTRESSVLVIIARGDSTIGSQLRWLFGLDDLAHPGFSVRDDLGSGRDRVGLAASMVLEQIGIAPDLTDDTWLDALLNVFGGTFPSTKVFSAYARNTVEGLSPLEHADAALVAWMEREEVLFRTLEKHLLGDRLKLGFVGSGGGAGR